MKRTLHCALAGLGLLAVLVLSHLAPAQESAPPNQIAATPWGVSSSASAFRDREAWFPKVAAAGVTSVRLFPEWRGIEPKRGTWQWDDADSLVKVSADNRLEINGILMGSPPGAQAVHAFPMEDLEGWSKYVAAAVGRYRQIRHWEVWNEGNGGFNDGKHTTVDYAKLAMATYDAAKRANPEAQIGLSVASFDAPYLHQTIRAMDAAGQPGKFDFLCVHPYELADGLANPDGEIPFLWMSRLLREMLAASAPERAKAEIWITEVGRRIEERGGRAVTQEEAAEALIKIYTLALAQGISRVQWFEAQDPAGEDQGFGLLDRGGQERDSYRALKLLATQLGPQPKYLGWLALGEGGRGYGFVFAGQTAPVLIAWMPRGMIDKLYSFAGEVEVIAASGKSRKLPAKQALQLTGAPVLVIGLPAELVNQAKANASRNFPWGGDFSQAKTASLQPTAGSESGGIVLASRGERPVVKFADGSAGIVMEGDIEHPATFFVHPSFADLQTSEYHVRVTVRRLAAGNVGMNLFYEVADSLGRSPYANTGQWFGSTPDSGWQMHTWHIKDACLSKMWGHDLMIRPEQSIPFALGNLEVSTEPFR